MGTYLHGQRIRRGPLFIFTVTALAAVLAILVAACQQQLSAEQKLEDFEYLFGILRDNHPYLDLKARTERYDWPAHEKEFKEAVGASRNDKEFAQAIQRTLLMINNGHTTIMTPQVYGLVQSLPEEMTPWLDEAAKTDAETVRRWFGYASEMMAYPENTSLPFRAWYCEGEYVAYWVAPSLASEQHVGLGQTIVSVNGVPIHEFLSDARGSMRLAYDPSRHRLFTLDFFVPYSRQPYRFEFRDPAGNVIRADIGFEKVSGILRPPYMPTHLGYSRSNVVTRILGDGKVAYLHLSQMTSFESSQAEAQALRDFFSGIKNLPALIIDIRANGGGDDRFWMLNVVRPLATKSLTMQNGTAVRAGEFIQPFLIANASLEIEGAEGKTAALEKDSLSSVLTADQLHNLPLEVLGPGFGDLMWSESTITPSGEYPYEGRVFLLVDPVVYSSAESFAQFCKATGWAAVVGQCTGGDGGASTPAMVTLPNSKIPVFFPSAMGLNPDGTANEETHTMPDVVVEPGIEDILKYARAIADGKTFSGPDPEYDPVLRECVRLALGE